MDESRIKDNVGGESEMIPSVGMRKSKRISYMTGAYGAFWGDISLPTRDNGARRLAYNTTTSTGRLYCKVGGSWVSTDLT